MSIPVVLTRTAILKAAKELQNNNCGYYQFHVVEKDVLKERLNAKKVAEIYQAPLKGFGVRADARKMEEAKKLGIDPNELFRLALDKALLDHSWTCPTCGSVRKKK